MAGTATAGLCLAALAARAKGQRWAQVAGGAGAAPLGGLGGGVGGGDGLLGLLGGRGRGGKQCVARDQSERRPKGAQEVARVLRGEARAGIMIVAGCVAYRAKKGRAVFYVVALKRIRKSHVIFREKNRKSHVIF